MNIIHHDANACRFSTVVDGLQGVRSAVRWRQQLGNISVTRANAAAYFSSVGLPWWATNRSCMSLACSSSTDKMLSSITRVAGS